MKLIKCIIPNSVYNFQVYCKMGERVDEKSSVLLGFKDCLPVITNSESNCKQDNERNSNKKVVKVEVDPSTGEKFINLNGKKLKMIPESQIKTKLNLTNQKNLCIKPTTFRVLTKIPFNSNAVQRVQTKVEAVNLMKLQSDDNSCHFSVLKKTNFISEKSPNIDKDNRHIFGNNLNKITTDNEKCNEFIDNASVDRLKCSTPLTPRIVDMKINKDEKDVHMLQLESNEKLQKNIILKNVETQTLESYFKNTDNILDLDIDIDDLNLFESSILSPVNPTWVNPPEQPTSNSLAQKFFEALRKALVPDHEGNMPIHVGVITKNYSLVRRSCFLLKILEQELDLKNNNNLTPLQLAVMCDSDQNIVECLLSNRASIEITDPEGNNLIHLAVQYDRKNLLPMLLSYCRSSSVLNQYNHEGMTPLLICSMKSLQECTKLLLAKGADVNVRDQISGRTALFHAAERKDKEMVQLLLTHNADTKIKNFFGTSAHDAMYEIEELPADIKNLILGKTLKRKNTEDTRGMAKLKKQVCLKTYARYEKVSDMTIKHFQKL